MDAGGRARNAQIGLNLTFVLFLVYLLVDLCSWLVVLAGTCSAVNEIKWTELNNFCYS